MNSRTIYIALSGHGRLILASEDKTVAANACIFRGGQGAHVMPVEPPRGVFAAPDGFVERTSPEAFRGASYTGRLHKYKQPAVWFEHSPVKTDWYWVEASSQAVRWYEAGVGWSVAVPPNVTRETAAHLATCRAEMQEGIRWAIINKEQL